MGPEGMALMRRIKALLDPDGLLNPGVIINDDPKAHLAHLKPMPASDAIVDPCIECGFARRSAPRAPCRCRRASASCSTANWPAAIVPMSPPTS